MSIRLTGFAVLMGLAAASLPGASNRWTTHGPYGGYVGFAASPSIVYNRGLLHPAYHLAVDAAGDRIYALTSFGVFDYEIRTPRVMPPRPTR